MTLLRDWNHWRSEDNRAGLITALGAGTYTICSMPRYEEIQHTLPRYLSGRLHLRSAQIPQLCT